MKVTKRFWTAQLVAVGLIGFAGTVMTSLAVAADATAGADATADAQLPAGWTPADMQAMMEAATPGEMHKRLANEVGEWKCKTKMWMAPNTDAIESEGTASVKSVLDGRYVQWEMKGEMPGMGPYNGMGIYGFDNVSKKFVSVWFDNFGTGMMNGEGELSSDGKTLTWEFKGNCPLTKKQIVMREIETQIDENTKKLEMHGPNPKTGEEFKQMEIVMTKN